MGNKNAARDVPIQKAEVLERIGGDASFLEELLTLYDEEFATKTEALESALRKKNFASLENLGHGLKGSSANLSLPGLQEASYRMETAGREKDIAAAKTAMAELKREYARLKEYFAR